MSEVITAGTIWQRLSKIDCSKHTEKKGNLTYLSWAWAWGIMMEEYPGISFNFTDPDVYPDGTMSINVQVQIGSILRSMWLPVMDHRNKPIPNPNAFQINTTKMRCLTKCFALFGLGHYIYAGEDLPPREDGRSDDDPITEEEQAELEKLVSDTEADLDKFLGWLRAESIAEVKLRDFPRAKAALMEKLEKQNASD